MSPTERVVGRRACAACVLAALWLAGGCGGMEGGAGASSDPAGRDDAEEAVRVLSYHLDGYGLRDRDGDGQSNDPKPETERAAAADLITEISPDVLAVMDIVSAEDLSRLAGDLASRGAVYPHRAWLEASPPAGGLAVFSRLPIVSVQSPTNLAYRIGDTTLERRPPILDVTVLAGSSRLLRIVAAECKDKTFHPLGQTEMRRNEARLLSNHLRETVARPGLEWVLTAVVLHDEPDSAPLQRLLDPDLTPAREVPAQDDRGRGWTTWYPEREAYLRTQYLLASPALSDSAIRASVVDHPLCMQASRHRPVLAVIPNREMPLKYPP